MYQYISIIHTGICAEHKHVHLESNFEYQCINVLYIPVYMYICVPVYPHCVCAFRIKF